MIITISITNLITSELIALVKILFSRQNTTAGTLRFLGGSGLMPKKWKLGREREFKEVVDFRLDKMGALFPF